MKRTTLKRTIGIVGMSILAMLFFACSDALQVHKPQKQDNKAMVTISVVNTPARTVFPQVSLEDVVSYKLFGGRYNGAGGYYEEETELAVFTTESTFVMLDIASWAFTLNAYNSSGEHILQGKVTNKSIAGGTNSVSFTLSVLEGGTGAIRITLNFPEAASITHISVSGGADGGVDSEDFTLTDSGSFVYTKNEVDTGDYVLHFNLYRENVLRAAISEQVLVRSNLTSSATITLEGDDLKRTLSGTASISPSAGVSVGTELTASYNGIETITTWQWNKDGAAIPGETGATYTPNETGNYTVTVGAETYNSKTSAAVGVVGAAQTVSGTTLADKLAWLASNAASYGNYILSVSADENIAPVTLSYSGKNNIVITLKGADAPRTVSLSSNGNMFNVGDTVTLILDENIILKGRNYSPRNNVSLVRIASGGALVMNTGSVITGNSCDSNIDSYGGGVYVNDGGTFTMNGGSISGNEAFSFPNNNNVSANSYGGGVYVAGGGTFTMNNGTIFKNGASAEHNPSRAYSYGGGVYVAGGGTFTMSGGTISENVTFSRSWNNAASSQGGGVYVQSNGTFTMSGGTISENKTETYNYPGTFNYSQGGGVYADGTFTMHDGTISSNTATEGGGVYANRTRTFTMNGGTISDNTASYNGGGVYADGTFTMHDGTISGNTAASYGGGVYGGTFFRIHKTGGTIYGYTDGDSNSNMVKNSSDVILSGRGHAVYVSNSAKRRETTARPGDNLDSNVDGADGGWEED